MTSVVHLNQWTAVVAPRISHRGRGACQSPSERSMMPSDMGSCIISVFSCSAADNHPMPIAINYVAVMEAVCLCLPEFFI